MYFSGKSEERLKKTLKRLEKGSVRKFGLPALTLSVMMDLALLYKQGPVRDTNSFS